MLASALSEVISLGAVLPFIGILTAPEKVFNNAFVKSISESFGITSAYELVLPVTVIFVCAALLAGATRLLMLWVSTRFSNAIGADLSTEIYKRTLYQPYKVHVARNSRCVYPDLGHVFHPLSGYYGSARSLVSEHTYQWLTIN